MSPAKRSRPVSVTPNRAIPSPTVEATVNPTPKDRPPRLDNHHTHAAIAATHNRSRTKNVTGSPCPGGTAPEFHTPPRVNKETTTPNGVSARGAKASTPAGSVLAPAVSDGSSHGKDTSTSAAPSSIMRAHQRRLGPTRATGTAVRPVITTDEKPPTAAGIRAHTIPARPASGRLLAGWATAPTTQGRPA